MKKLFLISGLIFAVLLTGCETSGGGSKRSAAVNGASTPLPPMPAKTHPGIVAAENPYVAGMAVGDIAYTYTDSHVTRTVTKTATGLEFTISDSSRPGDPTMNRTANFDDFGVNSDGFTVGQADSGPLSIVNLKDGSDTYNGTATMTDQIYLGSSASGLQYSEYGEWKNRFQFDGTVNGKKTTIDWRDDGGVFSSAAAANTKPFVSVAGNQTFTGHAIGKVTVYDDSVANSSIVKDLTGTASMVVSLAGGASGDLSLAMKNFYDFKVSNINLSNPAGTFTGSTGVIAVSAATNGKNNTGINLNDFQALNGDVAGLMAGNTTAGIDPTEIVGTLDMEAMHKTNPKKEVDMELAFGVKR